MRGRSEEPGPAGGRSLAARDSEAIADAAIELLGGYLKPHFTRLVQRHNLAPPFANALRSMSGPVPMKELGQRLGCDASFVTAIADHLEQRGLVRRETDPEDRRVKNLVLTARGAALRSRLVRELFDDLPGVRALDAAERRTLLGLLRRMVAAEGERAAGAAAARPAGGRPRERAGSAPAR